jgi:hypothetical protein
MKVGANVDPAMARRVELQKLTQQETIKQQQLKAIRERAREIERTNPQESGLGQHVDRYV